ncbi:hypothetical protein D3C79_908330 [compost metagenome]
MTGNEIVGGGLQLRTVLANSPCNLAAGAQRHGVMHRDSREDLLPKVRFVFIHDDERNHAGIQHLDQVLVLQGLRCLLEDDRWFVFASEALVKGHQALVVTGGLSNEDHLSRQIVHAGHCRRAGTGDDHLADVVIDG